MCSLLTSFGFSICFVRFLGLKVIVVKSLVTFKPLISGVISVESGG